jgi:hypothetical protein
MPARKKRDVIPVVDSKTSTPEDLRSFIAEAEMVRQMASTPGWNIMVRDLVEYKNTLADALPYLNTKTKEFFEARILFIASDKLLKLVDDYEENRKRSVELLERIQNTDINITLDVDNEVYR